MDQDAWVPDVSTVTKFDVLVGNGGRVKVKLGGGKGWKCSMMS